MDRLNTSPFPLSQLRSLCRKHPHAPKYLIVPRLQIGRALETALAREAGAWAGLRSTIPRHLASEVARPSILASGRTELPVEGIPFLVARILEQAAGAPWTDSLPAPHQVAPSIAEAVKTLRLAGTERETVREWVQSESVSETFRATAACYERFTDALRKEGLYDDADVFQWATEQVEGGYASHLKGAVVAVADGVDLPEVAYRFLEALRQTTADFYRIGTHQVETAPPQVAAHRFADAPVPQDPEANGEFAEAHFCRAVGRYGEVRAALRDIVNSGHALDDVEIAYGGSPAYLSLIADQAERVGVPLSLSTGLPATKTRTGQALQLFLEWVVEGFDVEVLIRMLRGGYLRLDRYLDGLDLDNLELVLSDYQDAEGRIPDLEVQVDASEVQMEPHEAATLLAARRYETGRTGYYAILGQALQEKTERAEDLEEQGLDPRSERREIKRLAVVLRVVDRLLELVPERGTIQEMAAGIRTFIETFGPVDRPPEEKPEEDRTLDEAARTVLWQRLERLTQLPFTYKARGAGLASFMTRWAGRQFVQAGHPRPGAAHVVPLESAGYSGRPHLYVVGMDSETLSTADVEDPLLQGADGQESGPSLDQVLPEDGSASDETLWRQERALARHAGPASFYTRTFDLAEGEERHPSSLFLGLERRLGRSADEEERLESLLPDSQNRLGASQILLDDGEAWLAAYRRRREGENPEEETAREELARLHPWIGEGESAARARYSASYTSHDGMLAGDAYPELDLFGEERAGSPVSASRLETFAETPYIYFLKYVLGVEPLDEPALDDEPWLNALRRGSILHDTFEQFMKTLGRAPETSDASLLQDILQDRLQKEARQVAPPSEAVQESAYRQLFRDALAFLRSEADRADGYEPLYHERGFGFGPYRRKEDDWNRVQLVFGDNVLPLRGRIDRVDRQSDGSLAIWDYKTGSSSAYDEDDPLADGAHLQWVLYAFALEELTGERVARSGYFFTSADEVGTRISFSPESYRDAVGQLLERLAQLARTGSFPIRPDAHRTNAWKWGEYDRIFLDLRDRVDALEEDAYPDDRPRPHCME